MMFKIADIEIARCAAEVFAYATEPTNTPKWVGFIESEYTNEWPPRLGTMYVNLRTDSSEKAFRVTAWEPVARFQMKAVDDSFAVEYTFEPLSGDSCRLRISLSTDLAEMEEATTMQSELETLKSLIESA